MRAASCPVYSAASYSSHFERSGLRWAALPGDGRLPLRAASCPVYSAASYSSHFERSGLRWAALSSQGAYSMKPGRLFAGSTAVIAWMALGAQLFLTVTRMTGEGASVIEAIWRFAGFFTILTNMAVAVVATAMTLCPASRCAGARARLVTGSAVVMVGLVYSLALRHVWQPEGLQALVDHALHDATPILFAAAWLFSGHGGLAWRDAGWVAAAPLGYLLYAMARGQFDGWYAYWFLDPGALSAPQFIANVIMLAAAFLAVGLAMIALDRLLAKRPGS